MNLHDIIVPLAAGIAIWAGASGLIWRKKKRQAQMVIDLYQLGPIGGPQRYETCGGCGAAILAGSRCIPNDIIDDWGVNLPRQRLPNCQWDRAPGVPVERIAFEPGKKLNHGLNKSLQKAPKIVE